MTVGGALRAALRDLYRQLLRQVVLNMALVGGGLAVAAVAALAWPALLLVVLLGPLLAALVHCEVVLVRTGELTLGCALEGLRMHWRRGLALAAPGALATAVGAFGVAFYARAGVVPLALLVACLVALLVTVQLLAWPLAVAEPDRPLPAAVRAAAAVLARRPAATVWLALALLLVDVLGILLGALPFLTVTVAYTFLAATHFVLPPEDAVA